MAGIYEESVAGQAVPHTVMQYEINEQQKEQQVIRNVYGRTTYLILAKIWAYL